VYLLYNIFLTLLALPALIGHLFLGVLRGRTRRGLRERFGFYTADRLTPLEGKKVIWVHAVSVGETQAAAPLVKSLKSRFPDRALVLSNVTETGHKVALGIAGIDLCLYFPYDFPLTVKRVFRQLRPELVVIVETEIWPNFVRAAGRAGVPTVLVNGRISDRSFPRYRWLRFFIRPVLCKFSLFCMQSPLDAERIVAMGAPAELVEVTRNLKFDMQTDGLDHGGPAFVRRNFGLPVSGKVLVAGSTHAGEEEQVIEVYRRLLANGLDLVLVLAPRHPERCRGVGELLTSCNLSFVRRSEIDEVPAVLSPGSVLLVDTVGELLRFYAAADLVFVGGSLVPVGGHNVLEAALLKKPVLFGQHMHNFKEISRLLAEAGGGIEVAGSEELYRTALGLLKDPERCRAMGAKGHALLQQNRGATERTLQAIERLLES
jgi:3-deoxy-D-manno-octulosonic-acid transferase